MNKTFAVYELDSYIKMSDLPLVVGTQCICIGNYCIASEDHGIAIGENVRNCVKYGIGIGYNLTITEENPVQIDPEILETGLIIRDNNISKISILWFMLSNNIGEKKYQTKFVGFIPLRLKISKNH
jgi:hypothetical protein